MKPFTIAPVRSLRPTVTARAYLGVGALFNLDGLHVLIVAPDGAGLEQVCERCDITVDLLLSKDVALTSSDALLIDDGLEDGI